MPELIILLMSNGRQSVAAWAKTTRIIAVTAVPFIGFKYESTFFKVGPPDEIYCIESIKIQF